MNNPESKSIKEMSPKMKFFFTRIFPLIFVVIGAALSFFGFRNLIHAKASLEWPVAEGMVVMSSVERHVSRDGNSSHKNVTYHAEVLYEYVVDGITFNGNRVSYGDYGSSSPGHARQIVNRYPEDKIVAVYYMPENPKRSVLETGVQTQAWILPVMGLVFFVSGSVAPLFIKKKI